MSGRAVASRLALWRECVVGARLRAYTRTCALVRRALAQPRRCTAATVGSGTIFLRRCFSRNCLCMPTRATCLRVRQFPVACMHVFARLKLSVYCQLVGALQLRGPGSLRGPGACAQLVSDSLMAAVGQPRGAFSDADPSRRGRSQAEGDSLSARWYAFRHTLRTRTRQQYERRPNTKTRPACASSGRRPELHRGGWSSHSHAASYVLFIHLLSCDRGALGQGSQRGGWWWEGRASGQPPSLHSDRD